MGCSSRRGDINVIPFSVITQSEHVTVQTHNKLMRSLNRTVMTMHAIQKLPRRFEEVPETTPGVGGLRYRRRGRKYTEAKQRKYGHKRPNVKEGHLRRAVLSRVKITATKDKATMYTRGTSEHRLADWQRLELERRTQKEVRESVKWQAREYKRLSQLPKYKRKRRRKSG